MSKQSEAMKKQNYQKKSVQPMCANCWYFTYNQIGTEGWDGKMYYEDKNLRCSIGGFAVKKMATCDLHKFAA